MVYVSKGERVQYECSVHHCLSTFLQEKTNLEELFFFFPSCFELFSQKIWSLDRTCGGTWIRIKKESPYENVEGIFLKEKLKHADSLQIRYSLLDFRFQLVFWISSTFIISIFYFISIHLLTQKNIALNEVPAAVGVVLQFTSRGIREALSGSRQPARLFRGAKSRFFLNGQFVIHSVRLALSATLTYGYGLTFYFISFRRAWVEGNQKACFLYFKT